MNTNKLIPLLLGALLPFSACRETEPELPGSRCRYVDVAVSLAQASEAESSRSIVDIQVENFQIAALFAFDAETGVLLTRTPETGGGTPEPVAAFPRQRDFSWSLPTGVRMDIYAIVNYGEMDLESYARAGLRKTELESLRFTSGSPSELKQLETAGYGMPMAGIKEGVVLDSYGVGLQIAVKKLYAKYNLYFDLSRIEAEGWHVQAMHIIVENANTEVPFFVENYRQEDPGKLVEYDRATEEDLDEIQEGGPGHAVTLYMLENCQGRKEGAESWKTVYKDLGFQALRNCTYIDLAVKVNRPGGEYQNLGFAIYLGRTDMRSDFDIVRNLFKTVKIVLPGPDDPNPASHFFKFSGTESPTVSPGESIDLYYVTNLAREDIGVSCDPSGRLTPTATTYQADADGIATGYVRLAAAADWPEGAVCRVTAGSAAKNATDQRTVTAAWPTVLEVDLAQAPRYVAQAGYVKVVPRGGIVRVDAEVKAGSEGILDVREAGVEGSLMHFGVAGLAAGTGTVVLHHFNAAGVETGSQEVDLTIQAPLLHFGMDRYTLHLDGQETRGTLMYCQADGTAFTGAALAMFDLDLVKRLLFPTDWLWVTGCADYVDAAFLRRRDDDLQQLTVPVTFQISRLSYQGRELTWEDGAAIGRVTYSGAPSANIPGAGADLDILHPFASLAGKSVGVIENNLPVYAALKGTAGYLDAIGCEASLALRITSYRNGRTFSIDGSKLSLELELPIDSEVSAVFDSPEEFDIACQGKKLILTAKENPDSYTGYGRFPLRAQVVHSQTGELSSPMDAGFLEIYLIGAVGPYIHGGGPYQVGGMVVPVGNSSPIEALASPLIYIRENTATTSLSGYYKGWSGSGDHIYYQAVEIDDHGIDRYAENGDTSYLNSYLIRAGAFPIWTDVMEFAFGSIFLGHGCGLVTAALESGGMLHAWFSEGNPAGKLRHFPRGTEMDDAGLSYCAIVNLFGGNGVSAYDLYLDIRE